jgi:hypothetical protein
MADEMGDWIKARVAVHGIKATVQYAGTLNGYKHWYPMLRFPVSGILCRAEGIKYSHKGRALRVAQRVAKEVSYGKEL